MKYNLNFTLLFLTIALIYSCTKKNKTNNTILPIPSVIEKQNSVTLIGTTDDPKAFEAINIINNSYLFGKNHRNIEKEILNDTTVFIILDSINNPRFMDFLTIGKKTSYKGNIYMTPGDTLRFEIKNGKLKFKGEKEVENNLFTELNNSTLDYGKSPYKGDLHKYKQNISSIYQKKEYFIQEYIKKNNITSVDFINSVKSNLESEYLNNLISPRMIKSFSSDYYFNDSNGLIPIIQKEYNYSEKIFGMNEYFDNVTIEDFTKTGLIENHFFKNNINAFIRYYFSTSDYVSYSRERLIEEKEYIQQNLEGDLQDYAIARMLRDYNKKGFGYSINNVDFMMNLIDKYEKKFINKPTYKEEMDKIKEDLSNFDFNLTDSALNSKLIDPIGDTVTLKEIFGRSSKRIRVIDFWASWCPPCIYEITKAKDFKDKLSIEDDVEWIYLSIDKDEKKWLKKSHELKKYLNVRNQYLILNGQNSSLAKSLKVKGIPRYVILNKKNQIVLNNAPKPSDSIIFKKIINSILKK